MPGDAFFSTSFTEKQIEKLKGEQATEIKLEYQRLDNRFMACGNVGYSVLQLTDVDEAFRSNLLFAYEWMREKEMSQFVKTQEDGKELLFEWNPVVALIYSKGQVAFPLGLKFNEDWEEQGAGQYGGFLDDGWSVMQDWKRGDDVAALSLSEPLAPMVHLREGSDVHRTVNEPLVMKATELEMVFVGLLKKNSWVNNECLNLKNLARHENWLKAADEDAFFLLVSSEGVRLTRYLPGKMKEELIMGESGQWVELEKK